MRVRISCGWGGQSTCGAEVDLRPLGVEAVAAAHRRQDGELQRPRLNAAIAPQLSHEGRHSSDHGIAGWCATLATLLLAGSSFSKSHAIGLDLLFPWSGSRALLPSRGRSRCARARGSPLRSGWSRWGLGLLT